MQPWGALFRPAWLNGEVVGNLSEALTRSNEQWLRAYPQTPNLYESGARYAQRPENWDAIPHALQTIWSGQGLDCKVLAAWRCAELRVRGREPGAKCVWSRHEQPGKVVYHVRVRRADGRIEDPSLRLGMGSALESSQIPYQLAQGY